MRSRGVLVGTAALLALADCRPDQPFVPPPAGLPAGPRAALGALLDAATLDSITPAAGVYFDSTEVTLHLSGAVAAVAGVDVGGLPAARVGVLDGNRLRAVVGPVGADRIGTSTVTVTFADGRTASKRHGFRFLFDQDPVVFVHGCPLPAGLGSVTNYRTSAFWRKLYETFRVRGGYPAAEWRAADSLFVPPALRPDSYLHVFVLSEDDHDPAHTHDPAATNVGGHCGSALAYARELRAFVGAVLDATGAPKVDLVVNSGGALGSRLYLKDDGGVKHARDVVFLAGMNHGTDVALFLKLFDETDTGPFSDSPNYDAAREGFPAYACEGEAPNDVQFRVNGCLRTDRRVVVDETPHDVHEAGERGIAYRSIYNVAADELIEPTVSACLNQRFVGDCTDPVNVPVHARDPDRPGELPHSSIRMDPVAIDSTYVHVTRRSHAKRRR